jgi:hypothetical protein
MASAARNRLLDELLPNTELFRSVDKDRFGAVGKGLLECQLALARRQVGRDQLGDIGIDAEMLRGVACRRGAENNGQKDDSAGVPNAKVDGSPDHCVQHRPLQRLLPESTGGLQGRSVDVYWRELVRGHGNSAPIGARSAARGIDDGQESGRSAHDACRLISAT